MKIHILGEIKYIKDRIQIGTIKTVIARNQKNAMTEMKKYFPKFTLHRIIDSATHNGNLGKYEFISMSRKSINYIKAITKTATLWPHLPGLTGFNTSALIGYIFDVPKEKVLNDLVEKRKRLIKENVIDEVEK